MANKKNTLLILYILIGLVFIAKTTIYPKLMDKLNAKSELLPRENNVFIDTYPNQVIENLWISYRDKIQNDGRVIDRSRDYITTSEGQSYALLRSVWMDDRTTFDKVLNWTSNNLAKRKDDELFAWKWGKDSSDRWDVLIEEGGLNTASDADQDIALALIFASKKWNDPVYMNYATTIIKDIWEHEVLEVNGEYYLLAGNWAKEEEYPTINPSYFSFAAYPIFAEVDTEHPWLKLKETSYKVLNEATTNKLGHEESANLPPDWVNLNKETGEIIQSVHSDKTTSFSDDAFRVIWRVGLDWEWHKDPSAEEYLEKLTFLETEWKTKGKLHGIYKHDGTPEVEYESNSMYGSTLYFFEFTNPTLGEEVYSTKIAPLYNPDTEEFVKDLGYYPENWVWFGIALHHNKLINLYEWIQ